jgi:hypothetical protein
MKFAGQVPYNWRCKVCEATNEHGLAHCNFCGSPAVLTPLHADILRRNLRGEPHPAQDLEQFRLEESLQRLPLWKRILAYFCLVPAIVGLAFFKFALYIAWSVGGLAIGLVSWLLFSLIMKSNQPPSREQK